MLVVYRYYILIYRSFLDDFRLGKGIANRPLAWGGNLPTDQATNRIGVFRPWKVNSTWIIDEIDSDTAVRASAQVELSQSLMGLLKASESFVFWVLESFENGGCLKDGLREPHNHNLCFLFLIYLFVSSQLQILLKQFLMISFEQEHPHSDPSGRGDAHYPRPFLHRSSIHAFRFTLRHGCCFG